MGRKNTESACEGDYAGSFHLFVDNTIMEKFVSNTNTYAASTTDLDWKKQLTLKELHHFNIDFETFKSDSEKYKFIFILRKVIFKHLNSISQDKYSILKIIKSILKKVTKMF